MGQDLDSFKIKTRRVKLGWWRSRWQEKPLTCLVSLVNPEPVEHLSQVKLICLQNKTQDASCQEAPHHTRTLIYKPQNTETPKKKSFWYFPSPILQSSCGKFILGRRDYKWIQSRTSNMEIRRKHCRNLIPSLSFRYTKAKSCIKHNHFSKRVHKQKCTKAVMVSTKHPSLQASKGGKHSLVFSL